VNGQMARLGLAEAQALAGQYDQAINTFKEMAQRKDGPLPIDGILMQLGRTYREAGKPADAQQTFNRIVQEFPESPFNQEAKRELDSLNKT
jgi:TolA-binding protein